MTATAAASLLAFSRAAWPPRLNMPTLYPVFPRLRVGMERVLAEFDGRGCDDCSDWPRARSGRAAEPKTAAVTRPPVLRKLRRLLMDGCCDLCLLITFSQSPIVADV